MKKKKAPKKIPQVPVSKGKDATIKQQSITPKQLKPTINIEETQIIQPHKNLPIRRIEPNRIIPYNDDTAKQILLDIANEPNTPIDQIAVNNGINHYTLHYWKILYDKFATSYYTAKEARQDVEVESIHEQIEALLAWLGNNEDLDPREKHVHIQALRLKMQNTHWTASKLSHRYRDTPGIQINIDAGGRRAAAWDRWQEHRAKK